MERIVSTGNMEDRGHKGRDNIVQGDGGQGAQGQKNMEHGGQGQLKVSQNMEHGKHGGNIIIEHRSTQEHGENRTRSTAWAQGEQGEQSMWENKEPWEVRAPL